MVGNCLWGYFASYAVKNVYTDNHKTKMCADIEGISFIKKYIPTYREGKRQHAIIKTYDTQEVLENGKPIKKIWRFKYGRFAPFLTALSRKAMYSTLRDHRDSVYRVHTDGLIVDKKMDLKMSKQMGHWKLANAATVVIHNSNFVDWL